MFTYSMSQGFVAPNGGSTKLELNELVGVLYRAISRNKTQGYKTTRVIISQKLNNLLRKNTHLLNKQGDSPFIWDPITVQVLLKTGLFYNITEKAYPSSPDIPIYVNYELKNVDIVVVPETAHIEYLLRKDQLIEIDAKNKEFTDARVYNYLNQTMQEIEKHGRKVGIVELSPDMAHHIKDNITKCHTYFDRPPSPPSGKNKWEYGSPGIYENKKPPQYEAIGFVFGATLLLNNKLPGHMLICQANTGEPYPATNLID